MTITSNATRALKELLPISQHTLLSLHLGGCVACGNLADAPEARVRAADMPTQTDADSGIDLELLALARRAIDAYDRQMKTT